MDGAKSNVSSCELPTGVKLDSGEIVKSIVFREMAGPEEDILGAPKLLVSQKLTSVLANCTLEFGKEKDPKAIRELIEKIVVTDRWFYLVRLRSHSLGSAYKFDSTCPECEKSDKIVVNLLETTIENPPDPATLFFDSTLPSKTTVRWRVADGGIEAKIEKLAKPDNAPTIALFCRAEQVNGKPATIADVKNLSMKDRAEWRRLIDAAEGDFDDTFEVSCPHCGHHYKGEMRLGVDFFSP